MVNTIMLVLAATSLAWWWAIDRQLRRATAARWWRIALALFAAGVGAYWLYVVVSMRLSLYLPSPVPMPWAVTAYLWHLIVLPATVGLWLAVRTAGWALRKLGGRGAPAAAAPSTPPADEPSATAAPASTPLSRRQVLAVAAAGAVPPLAALGLSARVTADLGQFRVRRADLRLPTLPPDLDGLTIAHVSDLHLGKFTRAGTIGRVADAVNAMRADLVAFTGDLIDLGAPAEMAGGIDFLRRLPRDRLAMIEGNHDLMSDATWFEQTTRNAGLPLLLDEAATFRVPGRATPVQVLGLTWGEWKFGREVNRRGKDADRLYRANNEGATAASVRRVAQLRQPDAFPILLAHHPHAFDPAAAAGFALVLAGHTHGGQVMLTDRIGGGPLRFRYWTGAYRRGDAQLFISNGIGHWFPLRVNAPAEIVHLTLRRA